MWIKSNVKWYRPCVSFNSAFGILKVGSFSVILSHFLQFSAYCQPLPETGIQRLTFQDRSKSRPLSLWRCRLIGDVRQFQKETIPRGNNSKVGEIIPRGNNSKVEEIIPRGNNSKVGEIIPILIRYFHNNKLKVTMETIYHNHVLLKKIVIHHNRNATTNITGKKRQPL